ncbi:F0F1 ATP synthase subunit A [Mesomycoplasma neurolyticum]|uniref:F0F1 ATP synthase subunit A n=1 Tax=Mesomycoplasma neurolyticum TaxID=2120 RepID=A0A449A4V4_9BACT|nr:F0F1 ATP synthase subunit A [Mesomycoplasma neurolyticum]VEU59244.1 F0F1 ATP synthase subunit A [Mesomycoplasma neurolyticum]
MGAFFDNWQQPQLFTLFVVVFLILLFSIIVYFKIKKEKADKAPGIVVFIAEKYYNFLDGFFTGNEVKKINFLKPYLFALFTFLLFGNLISLFGVEPIGSSISIPLTLTLMSHLGTQIIGIFCLKWRYFVKYLNPLEIVSAISPLLSLSFRLFGNIIGGSVILLLLYGGLNYVWGLLPIGVFSMFNLPASLFLAPFLFYFDIFGPFIQAYVFTLLTAVAWSSNTTND